MQTHAVCDNHVTLTFDLLTFGSTHAERLPCATSLRTLVLVAQAVFFFGARGDTDEVKEATDDPTLHASTSDGVNNDRDK